MPTPAPKTIAEWVATYSTHYSVKRLRVVIQDVLRSRLPAKFSDEVIAEEAELHEAAVGDALSCLTSDNLLHGVETCFQLSFDGSDIYFCQQESTHLTLLHDLHLITPTGFEFFCSRILHKLSATAVVDGGPYDGGVDFYAFGLSIGPDLGPAPVASRVFLLGQSKRYADGANVKETDLREFIGGAVRRAHSLRLSYSDRVGILTPTVFAYWVTSDFHHRAKQFAREMGIWSLSGAGLAQLAIRVGLTHEDIEESEKAAAARIRSVPTPAMTAE